MPAALGGAIIGALIVLFLLLCALPYKRPAITTVRGFGRGHFPGGARPIDAKLHCCCRCPAGENGSKRPLPRRRPPRLASARKPKPTSPIRTLFDNQLALNAGW